MAERTDDGRRYMPKLKCPYGNHRFADVPNVLLTLQEYSPILVSPTVIAPVFTLSVAVFAKPSPVRRMPVIFPAPS